MKTLNTLLIAALFVILSVVQGLAQNAQNILSNTTLNGAVTATQNFVVLTSATVLTVSTGGSIVAGNWLYVDREAMRVVSISGTRVTVARGVGGTFAAAHATSAVIFTGPANYYQSADPGLLACTVATMQFRPWINVLNGNVWLCKSSVWTATNTMPITFNSIDPY